MMGATALVDLTSHLCAGLQTLETQESDAYASLSPPNRHIKSSLNNVQISLREQRKDLSTGFEFTLT